MIRQSGYTLIELMISLVVMVIVVSVGGDVILQSMRGEQQFAAYSRDVESCRRVLRAVETDLRSATNVDGEREVRQINVNGKPISYIFKAGILSRHQSGKTVVLARGLAEFSLLRDEDLVSIRLRPRSRSKATLRRKALITTQVSLRRRTR